MSDPTSQLRSATRRAKSDVANKLVSMFLHELSRKICKEWPVRVDSEEYAEKVRLIFRNQCPYCSRDLNQTIAVIEHLDGMNRYRAGLHIPGNVLVACRRCNNEKRRDDSRRFLSLAPTGWESFFAHDGTRCSQPCRSCEYWKSIWEDDSQRRKCLSDNLSRIRGFRSSFPELEQVLPQLAATLPNFLAKLYSDCQAFAEREIRELVLTVESATKSKSGCS